MKGRTYFIMPYIKVIHFDRWRFKSIHLVRWMDKINP